MSGEISSGFNNSEVNAFTGRTEDAAAFGVEDKEVVGVKVESDGRSLIFGDVVCRVHPNFAPAMHIDTDESNAAFAAPGMMGEIVKL